jgi:hypothetical protein
MTDKVARVTLPREVAEAIEDLRKDHYDNRALIDEIYEGAARPVLQAYAETNFDTLLNALVNGYEIEKSPEDKVREYYETSVSLRSNMIEALDRQYQSGVIHGILKTLDLLDIKIPGVNADA